jgi:hypothetical protein
MSESLVRLRREIGLPCNPWGKSGIRREGQVLRLPHKKFPQVARFKAERYGTGMLVRRRSEPVPDPSGDIPATSPLRGRAMY